MSLQSSGVIETGIVAHPIPSRLYVVFAGSLYEVAQDAAGLLRMYSGRVVAGEDVMTYEILSEKYPEFTI
jgi:hypothetical protein